MYIVTHCRVLTQRGCYFNRANVVLILPEKWTSPVKTELSMPETTYLKMSIVMRAISPSGGGTCRRILLVSTVDRLAVFLLFLNDCPGAKTVIIWLLESIWRTYSRSVTSARISLIKRETKIVKNKN